MENLPKEANEKPDEPIASALNAAHAASDENPSHPKHASHLHHRAHRPHPSRKIYHRREKLPMQMGFSRLFHKLLLKTRLKALSIIYIFPFFVYVGVPALIMSFWKDPYIAYSARVLLTTPILVYFLKEYREIRIRKDLWGPLLGIVIFILWRGLYPFYPKFLGEPEGLNPAPLFLTIITLKFIGMVLLAPMMEELFFRSFLPRYFQAGNHWHKIHRGTFTPSSFIFSALIFGFLHQEWLPAVLMGFLMNWLFQKTKNLWPCIVAHAVANLMLWANALVTQNWRIW